MLTSVFRNIHECILFQSHRPHTGKEALKCKITQNSRKRDATDRGFAQFMRVILQNATFRWTHLGKETCTHRVSESFCYSWWHRGYREPALCECISSNIKHCSKTRNAINEGPNTALRSMQLYNWALARISSAKAILLHWRCRLIQGVDTVNSNWPSEDLQELWV